MRTQQLLQVLSARLQREHKKAFLCSRCKRKRASNFFVLLKLLLATAFLCSAPVPPK
jgi:hypothetical protein